MTCTNPDLGNGLQLAPLTVSNATSFSSSIGKMSGLRLVNFSVSTSTNNPDTPTATLHSDDCKQTNITQSKQVFPPLQTTQTLRQPHSTATTANKQTSHSQTSVSTTTNHNSHTPQRPLETNKHHTVKTSGSTPANKP